MNCLHMRISEEQRIEEKKWSNWLELATSSNLNRNRMGRYNEKVRRMNMICMQMSWANKKCDSFGIKFKFFGEYIKRYQAYTKLSFSSIGRLRANRQNLLVIARRELLMLTTLLAQHLTNSIWKPLCKTSGKLITIQKHWHETKQLNCINIRNISKSISSKHKMLWFVCVCISDANEAMLIRIPFLSVHCTATKPKHFIAIKLYIIVFVLFQCTIFSSSMSLFLCYGWHSVFASFTMLKTSCFNTKGVYRFFIACKFPSISSHLLYARRNKDAISENECLWHFQIAEAFTVTTFNLLLLVFNME